MCVSSGQQVRADRAAPDAVKRMTGEDKSAPGPAIKVGGMETAAKKVLKASLAVVAGWAVAGWLLFLLMMFTAMYSQG